MTALLLAAISLAAPQAAKKPDPAGRITVWVGLKVEHFKPDGTDVKSAELPDGYPYAASSVMVPDRTASMLIDPSGSDPTKGIDRGRLILAPVAEKDPYVYLEGYVALRLTLSADGSKVYFVGAKGEELPRALTTVAGNFEWEPATKTVREVKLPEKHTLEAVSADGKTFVTARVDADLVSYTRRTYLTPADGGKPVEIFAANVFPSHLKFSPDGTRLLARKVEYENVLSNGKGGFRLGATKTWEYVVLDTATRKETKLTLPEEAGPVAGLDWSPDGKKLVYWQTAPGNECAVFVADADGKNPKEVYKTKGRADRAVVMWR